MPFNDIIKKLPLVKYWLSPITKIRSNRYHRARMKQTAEFDKFYQDVFSDVEEGSLVVNVPEFQGSFEIDFRSHILRRVLKNKSYEPELSTLVGKYLDPTKDAIDVGANIGFFTVLMSKNIEKSKRVLAIEPTPLAFHYLQNNVIRNGMRNKVISFQGVATDKNGTYPLNIIAGKEEYSSMGRIVHSSVEGLQQTIIKVPGDTIDNLVKQNKLVPGFMKVDTEGAEMNVFRGAKRTIEEFQPVILTELSEKMLASLGNNVDKIVNFLRDLDYALIDLKNPKKQVRSGFEGSIIALPAKIVSNNSMESDYVS